MSSQDSDDSDDNLGMGFMFDAAHASTMISFALPPPHSDVSVKLEVIDEERGAMISGHYLWPGASALSEWIAMEIDGITEGKDKLNVVEVGAGCALCSLVLKKLFETEKSLKEKTLSVMVSDYDPGVLERAKGNWEMNFGSSGESEASKSEEKGGDGDVKFVDLTWGGELGEDLRNSWVKDSGDSGVPKAMNLVIGSDVIYSVDVVEPLFQSVIELLQSMTLAPKDGGDGGGEKKCWGGQFWMSQSFEYSKEIEGKIDHCCKRWGMERLIRVDEKNNRIQTFTRLSRGIEK